MRTPYPFLLILFYCIGTVNAQDIEAAINVNLKSNEAPIVYPYNGGSQLVFFSDDELRYFRLNNNFQIESSGSFDLGELGFKPNIYELNANRKNIHLFYSRRDSSGLRCFSINTINKKAKKSICLPSWNQNTLLLGHAAYNDTAFFFSSNTEGTITYSTVADGELLHEMTLEVSSAAFTAWKKAAMAYPQLCKTQILEEDFVQMGKIPFAPIKFFTSSRYIYASIEGSFTTHIITVNKVIKQMTHFSYPIRLPDNGSLRGSLSNSYVSKGFLFQAVSTQTGIVMQKTHLKSHDASYSKFFTYHNCVKAGAPVYIHNRGKHGTFARKPDNVFEYHGDKRNRFLALFVSTRGSFDHILVSEVEPLYGFEEWASRNTLVPSKEHSQKTKGIVKSYGLEVQPTLHFSLLKHISFKSSTIGLSLSGSGVLENFAGPEDFPIAEANVLFYKMKYSSLFPSHSSLCYFNNTLYYCFYRKTKKQYYFAALK